MKYAFPDNFTEAFMEEQMIDNNTALTWMLEYKKFLTLAYFSSKMITPSEQVDQVWHMHMTYTRHYRMMWQQLMKRPFKHQPTAGGEAENTKWDDLYNNTISLYEQIFLTPPPDYAWGDSKARFDQKYFTYRNVNIYRMAILFAKKTIDPDFLTKRQTQKSDHTPTKKMTFRRNKCTSFADKNQPFGWRKLYKC